MVLFALGGVVAWFTVEKALEFLLGVGGDSIQPFITADKYLTLVTLMIAAFGVAFEFPVLLVFLLLVRVVNTRQLRSVRRWMIVGIVTSRRSSPRARTRSPYSSWPFPCTSSTRSRS